METEQTNKKNYYIVGILGILVLGLILGLWYNDYFKHEGKDNNVEEVTKKQGQEDKTPSKAVTKSIKATDAPLPMKCAVNVNGVSDLFLGIAFLTFAYKVYGVQDLKQSQITFLSRLRWLVVCPMALYLARFAHLNYTRDTWRTGVKDLLILFGAMPAYFVVIAIILASVLPYVKDGLKFSVFFLAFILLAYFGGRGLLSRFLGNKNLNGYYHYEGFTFDIQFLFTASIFAYVYYQIQYVFGKDFAGYPQAWWMFCIPVAYLYVQNGFSPVLPPVKIPESIAPYLGYSEQSTHSASVSV